MMTKNVMTATPQTTRNSQSAPAARTIAAPVNGPMINDIPMTPETIPKRGPRLGPCVTSLIYANASAKSMMKGLAATLTYSKTHRSWPNNNEHCRIAVSMRVLNELL